MILTQEEYDQYLSIHPSLLHYAGIKNYHFGIYRDIIIASGKTKRDVEKQVKTLLEEEDWESIH